MQGIINKLKIDEHLTKHHGKPQKIFNSISNNIPKFEDWNFMADILKLPKTSKGYNHLLVVLDLATNEFDIEPLSKITAGDTLKAMLKMFKRSHIKLPYVSIRTDGGAEFKGVFHKYLYDHNILHKTSSPYRHKQMANVEALNKQLGRIFNGYMNTKEIETKKIDKNWDDILDLVRTDLNNVRVKDVSNTINLNDYPVFSADSKPKYKIGSIVHNKLDYPEDALGHKQPTPNFRVGDFRYSNIPKKIVKILYMPDYPYFRYLLEGIDNVSFSDYELIPSKAKETYYKVKKIIGVKNIKNKRHFLVWWDRYKKNESTHEPEDKLREDGLGSYIDEYLLSEVQ